MRIAQFIALFAYGALILLIFLWESFFAPSQNAPRLFWLGVKIAPLLLALYPLLRGHSNAYILTALLILIYFIEGVLVSYSAAVTAQPFSSSLVYGVLETITSVIFFISATLYARFTVRRTDDQAHE